MPASPLSGTEKICEVNHAVVTHIQDQLLNALYVLLPLKMAQQLQLEENAAACMLTGANRIDCVTPIFMTVTLTSKPFPYPVQDARYLQSPIRTGTGVPEGAPSLLVSYIDIKDTWVCGGGTPLGSISI